MSTEQNKAVVQRIVEAINQGNWSALDDLFSADYVEHAAPPGLPPGLVGLIQFFSMLRAAFPDFHYTVDDVIAEGEKVVQRVTGHGTMQGDFLGMPATGKHASWGEIHIGRFAGDKIVEHWASIDQLGMLQQLGLAPSPQ
jgi:steroid delta-isomerase-like uncharacterized protein